MQYIINDNRRIELDEDGFLKVLDDWTEGVAVKLSELDGITELTEAHWLIINYLRKYYLESGVTPLIRRLCEDNHFTLRQIFELFPKGPANGACKIAGLPKPDGCV